MHTIRILPRVRVRVVGCFLVLQPRLEIGMVLGGGFAILLFANEVGRHRTSQTRSDDVCTSSKRPSILSTSLYFEERPGCV